MDVILGMAPLLLFAFLLGCVVVWAVFVFGIRAGLVIDFNVPDSQLKNRFLSDVNEEIADARYKHPGNAHLLVALMDEVGKLAKAHLEGENVTRIWSEAKQVACVAARIALERDGDFSEDDHNRTPDISPEPLPSDSFCPIHPSRAHVLSGIRAGRGQV